ncbi:MAG: DNA-binding protein WhiA [Malacoplasma sp.]
MNTFTQFVKEEICRQNYNIDEIKSILSSYLKNNISINISKGNFSWEIKTQFSLIARFLCSIIGQLYTFEKEFNYNEQNKNKKTRIYKIKFIGDFDTIQHDLFLLKSSAGLLKNDTMKKAFLIGCFLSGGSVNNPDNSNYHLEIKFSNKTLINDAYKIIKKIIPTAKTLTRNNMYFIYVKKSEHISDFLKFVGAINAMFKYEEKRIYRDYSNQMHRLNNLDISNFNKSMSASNNQIIWINEIKKNHQIFNELTEKEKMFCELRLTHNDLSLIEISKLFFEVFQIEISKSALNHYVRKIKKLYIENIS